MPLRAPSPFPDWERGSPEPFPLSSATPPKRRRTEVPSPIFASSLATNRAGLVLPLPLRFQYQTAPRPFVRHYTSQARFGYVQSGIVRTAKGHIGDNPVL